MDVEIKYQNKDQSNKEQELAFLKLKPEERLLWFIKSSTQMLQLPKSRDHKKEDKSDDFIIDFSKKHE